MNHEELCERLSAYLEADLEATLTLVGRVLSTQDAPINEAEVGIFSPGNATEVTYTDVEGFYIVDLRLAFSVIEADAVTIEIDKPGFQVIRQRLDQTEIACAYDRCYARLPDVVLPRIKDFLKKISCTSSSP